MPVTTPAWLRTLSGPPTTPPLSTFTVANIRTHKISTQTTHDPVILPPIRHLLGSALRSALTGIEEIEEMQITEPSLG